MAIKPNQCIVAVVDDDPRVRESIQDLLSSAGFSVRIFTSAEDLLGTDDLEASCSLITDVRMPGIDGWELQRLVSARFPQLPIIFITSHPDEVARNRALELGAFAFLYKPFDGEELLEIVDAAIKQAHPAPKRV